jgi:hypothetical protein
VAATGNSATCWTSMHAAQRLASPQHGLVLLSCWRAQMLRAPACCAMAGHQPLRAAPASRRSLAGGIHTLEALAHAPKRELTAIKGLSEAKVEKLQKEGERAGWRGLLLCAGQRMAAPQQLAGTRVRCMQPCRSRGSCCDPLLRRRLHAAALLPCGTAAWKLVPMGFTTAAIVAEQRAELIKVTTGCKELDDILEGDLGGGAAACRPQLAPAPRTQRRRARARALCRTPAARWRAAQQPHGAPPVTASCACAVRVVAPRLQGALRRAPSQSCMGSSGAARRSCATRCA